MAHLDQSRDFPQKPCPELLLCLREYLLWEKQQRESNGSIQPQVMCSIDNFQMSMTEQPLNTITAHCVSDQLIEYQRFHPIYSFLYVLDTFCSTH
jgi:hypothetical protein